MKHALSEYQCVCCPLTSVAPPRPDQPQYSLCVCLSTGWILDIESEGQQRRVSHNPPFLLWSSRLYTILPDVLVCFFLKGFSVYYEKLKKTKH